MAEGRSTIKEIDNRDICETWIHIDEGELEPEILEISREEAMNLLEGFYVNATQDQNGKVDEEKVHHNEEELQKALQELVHFVQVIAQKCGFYVEDGEVNRIFHKHHKKTPEEDFKESFPELAREMRRGG